MFLKVSFNPSILLKVVMLSLKEGVELLLVVVHNKGKSFHKAYSYSPEIHGASASRVFAEDLV